MPLKTTQKKRIAELKRELVFRKRIDELERKNRKLEQELKIISKLPVNTHLGAFDKNSRSVSELFGNTPVMPKQEKNIEQKRNNHRKIAECVKWMNPILTALKELGGSGTPKEVIEKIAKNEKVPDEVKEVTLKNGSSKFENQVAWARQYLVYGGLIDGSKRGVWTLTPSGKKTTLTEEEARKIRSENDIILKNLGSKG